jgi:hypothetical protein
MSWVAAATAAGGIASSFLGGGDAPEAPSGPAISGEVKFGSINFAPRKSAASGVWPVVAVAAVVVLTLGVGLFFINRRKR